MAKRNASDGDGLTGHVRDRAVGVDPWAFQRWALGVTTGSAGRKAVLMMLATMADTNTGRCEAKQETLAQACEAAQRTVRDHLRALEEAGTIARRPQFRLDGGRRNDEFLLRAPWVSEWPDGTRLPGGAAESATGEGMQTAAQERPQKNDHSSTDREERARAKADEVPDDFPDALRPHARIVMRLLLDVAEQHNARQVTTRAVALAIMGAPGRRYVETAYELAGWAQDPPRPVRDVVGTYRTFLKRAPQYAGIEQVGEVATHVGHPGGSVVTPLRRRSGRSTAADYQALKGQA